MRRPHQRIPTCILTSHDRVSGTHTVALYIVVGARIDDTLETIKGWLLGHNAIVLSVIWLVLGATFVYEGFSTLAD
jgi:hypothetical protein